MDDAYTLKVTCQNCDYTGDMTIRKGMPVTEVQCPKCQCNTLKKVDSVPAPVESTDNRSISEKVSSDLGLDETHKKHDRKFGRVGVFKHRPF